MIFFARWTILGVFLKNMFKLVCTTRIFEYQVILWWNNRVVTFNFNFYWHKMYYFLDMDLSLMTFIFSGSLWCKQKWRHYHWDEIADVSRFWKCCKWCIPAWKCCNDSELQLQDVVWEDDIYKLLNVAVLGVVGYCYLFSCFYPYVSKVKSYVLVFMCLISVSVL